MSNFIPELQFTSPLINGPVSILKDGDVLKTRPRINIVEGTNVTIDVVDDDVNYQTEITINSAGSGTGGTVTSVDVSGGTTGLTFSGGPITTVGTLTAAGTVNVANGGTGRTTFSTAGYVKADGTTALTSVSSISGSDITGNITGNAANVTGTVVVANGGTGRTTFTSGYVKGNGTSALTVSATIPNTDIAGLITSGQIDSVTSGQITGSITASQIGSVNATSITGLITSGQITSVNATSITGSITSSQITSVSASTITGSITSGQISSVSATTITGQVQASQINTVAATQITGSITSGQITSVTAGQITGSITSGQISSVAATTITGSITSGQIGSVTAASITGVIVTSQLTDQIINTQKLIASDLSIIRRVSSLPTLPNTNYPADCIVLNTSDSKLYQNSSGTWQVVSASSSISGTLTSSDIASVSASSITGLIISSQIGSVAATTITGSITASQITSVAANQITGTLTSSQIGSVAAASITGTITSGQISSVSANSITGTIVSTQIGSVNASTITGSIVSTQITSVNASAITGSITSSQITSVAATTITGVISSTQIGSINASTITVGLISDSQINTISAGKLTAGTISAQTITLDGSSSILKSSNYSSGSAGWQITGNGTAEFMNATVNGTIRGGATSFTSGTGFWMGLDSGAYKFRVGDPAGSRISWDGSTWTVVGVPVSVAEAALPDLSTTSGYNIVFNKPSSMPSGYWVQYQQGSGSVTAPLIGFPFTLTMTSGTQQLIVWGGAPGYTQSQILYTSWNDLFL